MSLLFLSYDEQKQTFVKIQITRQLAKFLLETVTMPIAKNIADENFLIQAEVDLMDKNYSLDRFNEEQFHQAYDLIEENAHHPILEPYAKELLAKMQADPRFEAHMA